SSRHSAGASENPQQARRSSGDPARHCRAVSSGSGVRPAAARGLTRAGRGVLRRRPGARRRLDRMIAYWLALVVLKSLEWTPLTVAHRLARGYARLLDLALPRLRRTAYENLSFALPGADHRRIVDGVFQSIARVLVSLARFPAMEPLRCEGAEYFEAALREGRGVLFA